MSDDELGEYYFGDQFSRDFRSGIIPDEEKQVSDLERAQHRWNSIADKLPQEGKLLDIGCSWGSFISLAPEGIDAYGIDPSTGYVEYAQSLGLNAQVGRFPDDVTDTYDIISVFHVLEHVPDPINFLKEIYDSLSEHGRIVLEYPDIGRASMTRAQIRTNYFQRSHLYDFSVANLLPVLESIGFYVEFVGSYGNKFPYDKNLLLIARKEDTRSEHIFNSLFAQELYDTLQGKTIPFYVSKNSPLHILHIASHNINMGDGAISAGIRRAVNSIMDNPVVFTAVDIVDYANYGSYLLADAIDNHGFDLVLVGGGGTIDGHVSRDLTGTAFNMPLDELEKVKTPFGFVGLGHNVFPVQETFHMDKLEEFILLCKSRGNPFSVRRDGSWERLSRSIGPEAMDYTQRIADPGFFVPFDNNHSALEYIDDGRKNIIIQVAMDAYIHRFGGEEEYEDRINRFTEDIQKFASYVVSQINGNIIFGVHTLADNVALVHLFSSLEDESFRFNFRSTGLGHPLNASAFYTTYAKSDLVVGMRGHSVICGTGLGVPTVAISTHDKISGFMDEVGCMSECLYPSTDDFAELLIEKTNELLENPDKQRVTVMENTLQWRREFTEFIHQCLEQI
jgi:polysaccharide pyruvyl transferase WcaK-like protein